MTENEFEQNVLIAEYQFVVALHWPESTEAFTGALASFLNTRRKPAR